MSQEPAAGRKTDRSADPFETILLRQIGNCDVSLSRAFAVMEKHEAQADAQNWRAIERVDFFVAERPSVMRMVDGVAKLANATARLRREANLKLRITHEITAAARRTTAKNAGSIPKENVANDTARVEAAE